MKTIMAWMAALLTAASITAVAHAASGDILFELADAKVDDAITIWERVSGKKIYASQELRAMTLPGRVSARTRDSSEACRILEDALKTRAGIVIVQEKDGTLRARRTLDGLLNQHLRATEQEAQQASEPTLAVGLFSIAPPTPEPRPTAVMSVARF